MNKNIKNKTSKNNKSKKNVDLDNSKIVNLQSDYNPKTLIYSKKIKITFLVILLIFSILLSRLFYLQIIDGNYLKELAYKQQTTNQIISPNRGNIYDSTGKILATSAKVDTVTINPDRIKYDKGTDSENEQKTKEVKEKVAKALSEIFELDYQSTLEKVNSSSQVETIAKKVQQDKVEQLKTWMEENNISTGINIDEDNKRYYPYNTLASHVLGFCGNDNQGLFGIEYKWDSVLTGTPGKIVTAKDGSQQQEIPNTEETYIAAENGSDLTLTIDFNIQTIVEKYLKQAVDDNSCERGGNVIVMNPKNGDILAMASYPDYNLNEPYTPNSTLAKTYDSLDSTQKTNALYEMYRNKSVSELYEPGSVFKCITSAIALEENITETDIENNFICTGSEKFSDGTEIDCWRDVPHGSQSLRSALMNSCNPAFMQLGSLITAPIFYKYCKSFGLFNKTGVALAGEESSIFLELDKVNSVELATMSFGQRTFKVTPLQMITAIASIANDGILMQPRIVKQITNTDTGAITEVEPKQVRQVISKETASEVKSLMESVATKGTGRNGAVSGYSVGGKTGTSEPLESQKDEEGYTASYVAISPVENTEVVILLTLYDPQGEQYQGGQIAGPVVSQMLSEILPYLGIPSNTDESSSSNSENLITLNDVRNKTVAEAKKILTNAGFNVKFSDSGDVNTLIVNDQVPKPGALLSKDSTIVLYSTENTVRTSVTVPDLKGMTAAQATNALKSKNLNISIEGQGIVVSQDPPKDSTQEEGTIVNVTLKASLTDAH